MPRKRRKKGGEDDLATQNYLQAVEKLRQHPIFAPLWTHANLHRREGNKCPVNGWAAVTNNGDIHVHPTRRAEPEEWLYVLAHCLLHLGFQHFQKRFKAWEWNVACDCVIAKFLADLKFGRPPEALAGSVDLPGRNEERLYQYFVDHGAPLKLQTLGTAGPRSLDMIFEPVRKYHFGRAPDWQALFGQGLAAAVTSAVNVAAGYEPYLGAEQSTVTPAQKARAWFMSSYPLLGALAAAFEIIEDKLICARLDISVAAVDAESKEIFINPLAGLDEAECRFVIAHELLHVGLRHQARCQGRDPYIWNVACDFIINSWLVEMGVGVLPHIGGLHDPALKGESAEAIYDRIVTDMRRFRRLATLRGVGLGDMLNRGRPDWWAIGDGMSLDEFFRRCLSQGLAYCEAQGRGFFPAGLVEEIRALSQPPIPWDVELAQWFDHYFSPLEKVRSFARPSRRQSATPDIPRPRHVPAVALNESRTFGVVLDTSGTMDRKLLAQALGAIASYSISREVPAVRVVFCDALPYDQGYLLPEAIADRVQVKGRGGTILQPAIDLLEKADDFPKNAPLLIITDGYCDKLSIAREHAFLLPEGRHLPFVARGKVFRIK